MTLHKRVKQMAGRHSYEWWRPDALLPALIIVGPYYFNKLVYAYFPGYPVFVAMDYACRTFSLAFLYLLLRNQPTSLPIPWRLAVPSTKELLTAFIGATALIGASVAGTTLIRYLNAHSWSITRFPFPTSSALQFFDGTIGMVFCWTERGSCFSFLSYQSAAVARYFARDGNHRIDLDFRKYPLVVWCRPCGFCRACRLGTFISLCVYAQPDAPIIAHAAFDAFYFAGGVAFLWRIYGHAW